MKSSAVCDKCKADGFWERKKAECANCGVKVNLCPGCKEVYVTCSEACSVKWREQAKTILFELLPSTPRKRRRKTADGQASLF